MSPFVLILANLALVTGQAEVRVMLQPLEKEKEIKKNPILGLIHGLSNVQVTTETEPTAVIAQTNLPPAFHVGELPTVASQIVGGFIQSFLDKEKLLPGEEQCLKEGTTDMTKDILIVASHVVMLAQELLGIREDLPALGKFAETYTTPSPTQDFMEAEGLMSERLLKEAAERRAPKPRPKEPAEKDDEEGDLIMDTSGVLIELGMGLQKIAALGHQVMHSCLQEDGQEAIAAAMEHMMNLSYVGTRILVNGRDVCKELSHATHAWTQRNRTAFGQDVGKIFRDLVLSDVGGLHDGFDLDHMPSSEKMMNISEAFLSSFFGRGFEVEFQTLDHKDVQEEVTLDLHECFGRNANLVGQMWASLTEIYKSQMEKAKSEVMHTSHKKADQELKDALTYDLMQIPAALTKCNLDAHKQQMLQDAYMGLGSANALSINMHSNLRVTGLRAEQQLDELMWEFHDIDSSSNDGVKFGHTLGKLFQELLIYAFPKKYSLDEFGRLQLEEKTVMPYLLAWVCLAFGTVALTMACRRREVVVSVTADEIELLPV